VNNGALRGALVVRSDVRRGAPVAWSGARHGAVLVRSDVRHGATLARCDVRHGAECTCGPTHPQNNNSSNFIGNEWSTLCRVVGLLPDNLV
jgi:hypothetical protein